jgi:hypothetical protein
VWAAFLSNVVIVGAYWWSFFAINLCPTQSGAPETFVPKPVQHDPVLAQARKPPDKAPTVPLFTNDELKLCFEVLSVALLLAKEGLVCVPTQVLLVCSVMLMCYIVSKDGWLQEIVLTSVYWALMIAAEAWYWFFYAIAIVDCFFIRPYFKSWIDEFTQMY